jgi:bifunctional non-homologous end joining protein LigD
MPLTGPPNFIASELAQLVERAPAGDDWLSEIKFDGYRTGARLKSGRAVPAFREEVASIACRQ